MRSFAPSYYAEHVKINRCKRFFIRITYRDTEDHQLFIPSHRGFVDFQAPELECEALIADNGLTGAGQQIQVDFGKSTVSAQTVSIVDINGSFSEALAEMRSRGTDIRDAVVTAWEYYATESSGDTDTVLLWTQKVRDHSFSAGVWQLQLTDTQADLKVNVMTPLTGRIMSVDAAGAPSSVYFSSDDVANFDYTHDANYRVDPSQSVSYWRITSTDEIFSVSQFNDNSATVFGEPVYDLSGLSRGKFNTTETALDTTKVVDYDSSYEIEEVAYLEGHPADLICLLWTGTNLADSLQLQDHWHAGLARDSLNLFDLYQLKQQAPSLRMMIPPGEKDALTWVQDNLLMPLQWQFVVSPEGLMQPKKAGDVEPETAHDLVLTESDFTSIPTVSTQSSHLVNVFQIKWNYSFSGEGEYLDNHTLIAEWSRTRYGESTTKTFELQSIIPSSDAYALIASMFSNLQRNFAQPRTIISGQIKNRHDLEVADVARVVIEGVDGCSAVSRDYRYGDPTTVNRSFESHQASYKPFENTIDITLFGSGSDTDIPPFTYGDTEVPEEATLSIGNDWPYATTITGNLSVAPGVYHVDGDWSLISGATLTLSSPGTLVLAVSGEIVIDGTIDFSGMGAAAGQSGGIGKTASTGGVTITRLVFAIGGESDRRCYFTKITYTSNQQTIINGANSNLQGWSPAYTATGIDGYPTDLTGTGGAAGGDVISDDDDEWRCNNENLTLPDTVNVSGGAGGAGGGGLVTFSNSLSLAASGQVILNGEDASASTDEWRTVYGGSGGGGDAGGWLHVALSSNPVPALLAHVEAYRGGTDDVGNAMPSVSLTSRPDGDNHSYYEGYSAEDLSSQRVRVVYATTS